MNEARLRAGGIDQGVVRQHQAAAHAVARLGAHADQVGVLRFRALGDQVAHDHVVATVRKLDLVRGFARRPVVEVVVEHTTAQRPRLQQVAAPTPAEAAAADAEFADRADVQQVMQRSLVARRGAELAAGHVELHVGVVGGQDAHLVVEEAAAPHGEPAPLEADAGPVASGHAGTAELEVLDHDIPAHDQNALAFGIPPVSVEHGASAETADRQPRQRHDRRVAVVLARLDLDDVAAGGCMHRGMQRAEALVGADTERPTHAALCTYQQRRGQGQSQRPPSAPNPREPIVHSGRRSERKRLLIGMCAARHSDSSGCLPGRVPSRSSPCL
ncbi:MAG TPA: hypothetical protein PKC97_06135 [Burkholderiaceae bacterium]|nr:hypothetical protein [Burkholderiaceae bacterium]